MLSPDDAAALTPQETDSRHRSRLSDLSRAWIAAQRRHDIAAAELKVAKKSMAELSREILDQMIEEGVDTPPAVDQMKLYLSPKYYVDYRTDPNTGDPYDREKVAAALIASGLESLITTAYNGNSLRATLREIVEAGKAIPPPLAAVIDLVEEYEIRAVPLGGTRPRR